MADVQFENFVLASTNNAFSAVWKWTRALKKAGWVYLSSADGTSKDTTGTAANDKWGGAADPANDGYPTALDTVNAWWNAQGPTTLMLSMTSAPTGSFVRGEKVTQATSGAEGEFQGFDFDGVSAGHAVVLPRTGTFDATHVVTGAVSGATFTPTALGTFVREIVIFKSTDKVTGSLYMQVIHNETENASRFSVLATSAGCTATVAPGAGGTGNTFPTPGSWVWCGSQNGSPAFTHWFGITTGMGVAQIVATNITTATGLSADGTAWIALGNTTSPTQCEFFGYFKCDGGEDADLDPYVTFHNTSTTLSNGSVRTDSSSNSITFGVSQSFWVAAGIFNQCTWRGWRRRGFASGDAFSGFAPASLIFPNTSTGATNNSFTVVHDFVQDPEKIACSYTTKYLLERIWLATQDPSKKIRKGNPRWLNLVSTGNSTFDTIINKTRMCIMCSSGTSVGSNAVFGGAVPSLFVGPLDGSTVPSQWS